MWPRLRSPATGEENDGDFRFFSRLDFSLSGGYSRLPINGIAQLVTITATTNARARL